MPWQFLVYFGVHPSKLDDREMMLCKIEVPPASQNGVIFGGIWLHFSGGIFVKNRPAHSRLTGVVGIGYDVED